MNVSLEPLRTRKTTELTKSYLAEVALQLLNEQDRAIAAAVQAEREACAKVADNIEHDGMVAEVRMKQKIAAAIRARGGTGSK